MGKKYSKFRIDTTKKGQEKRTFDGILFDSELEMKCYRDYLIPLKESGEIKNITLQPKYILLEKFKKYGKVILPIYYVSDFKVEYSDGREIVYDAKGLPTESAKLKRKLFDSKYPDKTLIWIAFSAQDGGWLDFDYIQKCRRKRKQAKKELRK